MSDFFDLERGIADVVGVCGPGVVGVRSGRVAGTGFIIATNTVLTNAHNVPGRSRRGGGPSLDEARLTVDVVVGDDVRAGQEVAVDADADLAVITVDTADGTPLAWSDRTPNLGSALVALANPAGRGLRATFGTVSALDQQFRGPQGRTITGGLEHTAALQRGSSGGPIVDGDGNVIGVNTLRLGDGFYLAMPADAQLRQTVTRLQTGEMTARPQLGVAVAPSRVARKLRAAVGLPEREGLLVHSVVEDSPAAAAGLVRGDLLVAVNDQPLANVDDLHTTMDTVTGGSSLTLGIVRGVDETTVTVTLDGA